MKFKTILIDPPWYEKGGGKIKRGADRHYKLLKTKDIIRVIKEDSPFNPAENCHLYLWSTNNFLKDALKVIEALEFRYITNIAWVKDRFGLGYYFRGQHELLLFATKGHIRPLHKDNKIGTPTTVIHEKKTRHSQKPEASYKIINMVSPEPRLELFARRKREGWTTWGDEDDIT